MNEFEIVMEEVREIVVVVAAETEEEARELARLSDFTSTDDFMELERSRTILELIEVD